MLFAFWLTDRPGAGDLRQRVRPQHKEYLAQVQERIAFARWCRTATAARWWAACW